MLAYYDIVFTNSSGNSISIGSTLPYLLQSINGLDMPQTDIQTKRAPYQDGTTFTDALLQARELGLIVHVKGADDTAIYSARDALGGIFSPKLGEGTLSITYQGITREITCVCERVTMPNSDKNRVCGYQAVKIDLYAANPAIVDQDFIETEVSAFTGGFSVPFSVPFNLGSISDDVTINNTGHLERPIVIVAEGGLSNPIFTNTTTGEKIELTNAGGLVLASGETLTIDTNPSSPSVTVDDGSTVTNAYKYLSSDSVLWQLALGDNDITFTATAQSGDNPVIKYKKGYITI